MGSNPLRHRHSHSQAASVDPKEAAKFTSLAAEWWDPAGAFGPLHRLNWARCKFVRDAVCALRNQGGGQPAPLQGMQILDVGCGGGILSESLARLGGHVHGIDLSPKSIGVAQAHARRDPAVAANIR